MVWSLSGRLYDVPVIAGPFASFAQNGEDVVLWRALGNVDRGRYVDVGANDPSFYSVTRAFYDRGWRGIVIEPVPDFAELFRAARPDDIVVQVAVGAESGGEIILHEVPGTGLSTLLDDVRDMHRAAGRETRDIAVARRTLDDVLAEAGWDGEQIHFVTIDTEGSERDVLLGFDLKRWRPWVMVIEATAPLSTDPTHEAWEEIVLAAGYQFCLFDGLSRFYVSPDRAADLTGRLAYSASVFDDFTTYAQRKAAEYSAALEHALAETEDTVVRWRTAALSRWTEYAAATSPAEEERRELQDLRHEVTAIRKTLSWRVTRPLRLVRGRMGNRG